MPQPLTLLLLGDIVGKSGRRVVQNHLPRLIEQHHVDFVVANGENLAAGFGLTIKTAEEMFTAGVHVLTNGNHCWDQKDFLHWIEEDERFVRPLNFSIHAPGRGWTVRETASGAKIAVINLIGQVFMGPWDCPFAAVDAALQQLPKDVSAIVVDFHAEATSEKMGMGWYLDGRVSVVYGTHTHVPTCDETILPNGTAYQTDLGMCGPYRSVIGMKVDGALRRLVAKLPQRFEAANSPGSLFATCVEVDPSTRKATAIQRIAIPGD